MKIHGFKPVRDGGDDAPCASHNLDIKIIPSDADVLADPNIQMADAKQLHTWMIDNLPHGTYTELRKLIKEESCS
jgi:hypothetical protein